MDATSTQNCVRRRGGRSDLVARSHLLSVQAVNMRTADWSEERLANKRKTNSGTVTVILPHPLILLSPTPIS
jgi:hypothetical protein